MFLKLKYGNILSSDCIADMCKLLTRLKLENIEFELSMFSSPGIVIPQVVLKGGDVLITNDQVSLYIGKDKDNNNIEDDYYFDEYDRLIIDIKKILC